MKLLLYRKLLFRWHSRISGYCSLEHEGFAFTGFRISQVSTAVRSWHTFHFSMDQAKLCELRSFRLSQIQQL